MIHAPTPYLLLTRIDVSDDDQRDVNLFLAHGE
jgi:hypothetical protein